MYRDGAYNKETDEKALRIDELWVGHTKAWTIPGTEDLKPYINKQDRIKKWAMGTVGFAEPEGENGFSGKNAGLCVPVVIF